MRFAVTIRVVLVLGFSGLAACAALWVDDAQPTLPLSQLVIHTATAPVALTVELADDAREIQTGMMFRRHVDGDSGMLFDMGTEREAAFWMHNTLIPLDIIFITGNGVVHRIAANAPPLSDELIYSYGPIRGVLEIGGGRAAELGIAVGDTVVHPLFGNAP